MQEAVVVVVVVGVFAVIVAHAAGWQDCGEGEEEEEEEEEYDKRNEVSHKAEKVVR